MHSGLWRRKLCPPTIAEFSALPQWVSVDRKSLLRSTLRSETRIRLDDPLAIANDAAPDGFKIVNVVADVHLLDRQRHQITNKTLKKAWVSCTMMIRFSTNYLQDVIRAAARRVGSTTPFPRIYRPPSTVVGIFVDKLANVFATVVSGCSDHLLLCRDVNCSSTIGPGFDERLLQTFKEFGLT